MTLDHFDAVIEYNNKSYVVGSMYVQRLSICQIKVNDIAILIILHSVDTWICLLCYMCFGTYCVLTFMPCPYD